MLYGSEPTVVLSDRGRSPPELFPLVYALCSAPHLEGSKGRKFLRRCLGREHEISNQDIPGMRGFPVWRYALDQGRVCPAPAGASTASLPMVYILGPTARKFMSIHASAGTTSKQAHAILEHLARALDVPAPPKPQDPACALNETWMSRTPPGGEGFILETGKANHSPFPPKAKFHGSFP